MEDWVKNTNWATCVDDYLKTKRKVDVAQTIIRIWDSENGGDRGIFCVIRISQLHCIEQLLLSDKVMRVRF